MYDTPQSDLNKYQPERNRCPKCGQGVSVWDYAKPGTGIPNSIQCRGCGGRLRYSMGKATTYFLSIIGVPIALLPAYWLWQPDNLLRFTLLYLPLAVVIIVLSSVIEALLVRKFLMVEFVEEGKPAENNDKTV